MTTKQSTMTKPEQKSAIAKRELLAAGCVFEKKEDRQGVTKAGWWQDDVFLASTPVYALEAIRG